MYSNGEAWIEEILAAGLVRLLELTDGNLEAFEEMIRFHRIALRIANSASLRKLLTARQLDIVESVRASQAGRAQANRAGLLEVSRSLGHSRFLQIKGSTVSDILGGESFRARSSSDVDLIFAEGGPQELVGAGFVQVSQGVGHEFGTFTKRGCPDVDLHFCFPVWRLEHGAFRFREISTSDLLSNAIPGRPGSGMILRREAAAVILMLAVHLDWIEHPLWRLSKVRLSDLVDYVDLTTSTDFDSGDFRQLMERWGADQAYRFIEAAIRAILGQSQASNELQVIEVGRGISVSIPIDSRVILDASSLLSCVSSWFGTARAWRGDRLTPHEGKLALPSSDFDPVVLRDKSGVDVSHPLLGGVYKEEVRITTKLGSAAIQFDHRNQNVFLKSPSHAFNLSRASISNGRLSLRLSSSRIDGPVLVGHSRLDSWESKGWQGFYEGLRSGVALLQVE